MFEFLHRSRFTPIAIDIGADSVKMLQLRRVGQTLIASACSRMRLPETATSPAAVREMQVAAVRQMLKSGGFRGRRAVTSLSCEELSIKNVRLPHGTAEEMARAVQQEAVERFGPQLEGGQLTYLNAGQVRQGAETRDEVILIGVPAERVEERLRLLSDMGLAPERIEAQPVALFRVFERFLRRQADASHVSVLVDLGRSATRVIVGRGRQIIFIKSIDVGGARLTEAVAKQLRLSAEEASDLRLRIARQHLEQAREGQPVSADDERLAWTVRDAVRGEVESLARELALCLRYCAVTFRGLRAEHMTLTGGEAYDPALAEMFSEHLKMSCVLGQPLRGIDLSAVDFGSDRRGMLAEWALCVGLAIRDLSLPQEASEGEHGEHRLSA